MVNIKNFSNELNILIIQRRLDTLQLKGFEQERTQEAPGGGCLSIAKNWCSSCRDCFNQHLKNKPSIEMSAEEIINEVKKNPFNEGIILGGLEWFNQIDDMKVLMKTAADSGLKIMVYTGFPIIKDESIFKECSKKVDTYLKIGPYVEKLPQIEMYGIVLASNNQKIIKY